MDEPSGIERIMGSVITKAGATYLAAVAPYAPVAALFVPLLCDTLAFGRYQKRIEKVINEIQGDLAEHRSKVENLTDAQLKFVNETISTALQTLEGDKLSYLRRAIRGCVNVPDMTHKEASVISRIIRDISVDEIRLLMSNSHVGGLAVSAGSEADKATCADRNRAVVQDTPDNVMTVSGLISLGLLVLDDNVFGNTYSFSPIVEKFLALVVEPTTGKTR